MENTWNSSSLHLKQMQLKDRQLVPLSPRTTVRKEANVTMDTTQILSRYWQTDTLIPQTEMCSDNMKQAVDLFFSSNMNLIKYTRISSYFLVQFVCATRTRENKLQN